MTNDTDIDNDGDTDALDLARVRMAFWTKNPEGDVNHDGRVNAIDIALTRKAMFETIIPIGDVRWDAEEEIFFNELNDYRAHPERWQLVPDANGNYVEPDRSKPAPPILRSYRLSQAAQWMAQDCIDHNYLSHDDRFGRDAGARMVAYWDAAKFTWMGEIALGVDQNVEGWPAGGKHSLVRWILSPGHNAIMISQQYKCVGVGHAIDPALGTAGPHRWFADFSSGVDTAPWP